MRPPNLISIFGIIVGLAGAGIIIFSRNTDFSGGATPWILLALLIPVFLGAGNVYRTMAWPFGASPRKLAAHTNLAAVPFLALAVYAQTGTFDLRALAGIPELVALQLVVSTVMFLMFFRLQQVGGPTYLSQIGYVAAAVGVVIGVLYFGEIYPPHVWVGAGDHCRRALPFQLWARPKGTRPFSALRAGWQSGSPVRTSSPWPPAP